METHMTGENKNWYQVVPTFDITHATVQYKIVAVENFVVNLVNGMAFTNILSLVATEHHAH